jgi:hypothetical protein
MDRYFRVAVGAEKAYLLAGLERIRGALRERFGVLCRERSIDFSSGNRIASLRR